MVCTWSPELPNDTEERLSAPTQVVAVESDDSEDETLGNAPAGYELLPQAALVGMSSDDEEQSEGEATTITAAVHSTPVDGNTSSAREEILARRRSEVEEIVKIYSSTENRPDINVNCEEVRAAMSGFTLPPSAIPQWAASIPETQWASTLVQQIQRLQLSTSAPLKFVE